MEKSKIASRKELQSLIPEERLKKLYDNGADISFDHNIPIKRYYQAGKFIIRQVDVYMREGNYEQAYTLYIKFMIIFLHKISDHPQYKMAPNVDKEYIKLTLREVLPKTELLKKKLRERYAKEYKIKEEEFRLREEQEKAEIESLAKKEKQRLKDEEERKNQLLATLPKAPPIAAAAITNRDEGRLKLLPIVPSAPPAEDVPQISTLDRRVPSFDRSTKPSSLLSGEKFSLRDVIVPSQLMDHFLTLAFSNTSINKETCGILAGKLERNRLLITHILIPKQTGSPDSCVTHNEEDIFDFQDQHSLITLGWIHTHPTQTAFLSSVDLHTHCAYQLMMAEAIAIVCAPKYEETGFYHLTPEYGLNFIANCRQSGFHPHPSEPALYSKATHFKFDPKASIEAVDLRLR